MTPYKRTPRRHFTDVMFNPYFKSNHYEEEHTKMERSVEKGFYRFIQHIKKLTGKK